MQPFDRVFDGIDAGVEALFTVPNIALWIAFALFGWCAAIILYNAWRHHLPFARALRERLDATAFLGDADDAAARTALVRLWPQVDVALSARGVGGGALSHAWRQYRETLVDTTADPIAATARPEAWFLHLGDETRVLAWWANIFVAVGLTFTFLGIVAALLKAVQAMGAGADPASMQIALVALLHITAAKFWTSIGGVLSSIVLRVFDRRWHARNQRGLQRLCDRIETGTVPVSPHRLAADQLTELRRQSELLDRAPVQRAGGGGGGDVGSALAGLADGLAAANRRIEGASDVAGAQIAEAAARFAQATDRLAATLDVLDTRVGGMAETIAARAAQGVDAALDRTVAASAGQAAALTAASDEVKTLLATLGRVVGEMGGVFAPVRGAALSIERAVATTQELVDAASQRAERSDRALQATAQGVDQASQAATRAWETYRDRFDAVDAALGEALRQINAASIDQAATLTAQVARVDGALAQAVDRLSGALEVIGDLAAALDDMRAEMRAKR